MREYDTITLKRVQAEELAILNDFIQLCNRHNITYFGIAGTGIGALRHKGFIPWDDDIDVAMPRKDFNQFLLYAKKELSSKYMIMNTEEDENYPLLTTRLMKRGTQFREEALKDINCPLGIFLDIYPLDNISDDPKIRSKQFRKAFVFSKLLILRSIAKPVLAFRGWKASIVYVGCFLVHWCMRLLHIPKKFLYRKCMEANTMCNEEETEYMDFLCDTTPYMNIHKKDGVFPLLQLPFEHLTVNFPGNIHDNLTAAYGDYMQLPPEDKRKNHFPYTLVFGDEE